MTRTGQPTATGTPAPAASVTPTPTVTQANVVTINAQANVRTGPSTAYPIALRLTASQTAPVIGRDSAGHWFEITIDGAPGGIGWVSTLAATYAGDINSLPVVQPAGPPPTPAASSTPVAPPTNTGVPNINGIQTLLFRMHKTTGAINESLFFDFQVVNITGSPITYGILAAHTDQGYTAELVARPAAAGQGAHLGRPHQLLGAWNIPGATWAFATASHDACKTGGAAWTKLSASTSVTISIRSTMKAIVIHEFGEASQLCYEDAPVPEPKPGELRVKVAAVGVNFAEIYARRGWYPSPRPFVPGTEFAGTVDQVGAGVTEFKPGDRVATANGRVGYAEYAPRAGHAHGGPGRGRVVRAGGGAARARADGHYLATSTFPLKPGDTALVHAAAGGVGQLLVQMAKARGARVIATVSTEAKARPARELGADDVILYSTQDFEAETKRLTGGKGVDVVYDSVGKDTFEKSLNCLRPRGLMALYGQSSGRVEPQDPQILNRKGSLFLTRPTLAHYVQTREEFLSRADDLFNWVAAGTLKVRLDKTFPLAQTATAQTYMEERRTLGKVLLVP